jgi:hypothetical protein
MVIIRKVPEPEGVRYRIDDFPAYVEALQTKGIEPPPARYQLFVSLETLNDLTRSPVDLEEQIALFFQIGSSSGIEYAVTEE